MEEYRESQRKLLDVVGHTIFTLGNVTSVNLTMINGGVQENFVPSTITLMYDFRLAIDVDHVELEAMVYAISIFLKQ